MSEFRIDGYLDGHAVWLRAVDQGRRPLFHGSSALLVAMQERFATGEPLFATPSGPAFAAQPTTLAAILLCAGTVLDLDPYPVLTGDFALAEEPIPDDAIA